MQFITSEEAATEEGLPTLASSKRLWIWPRKAWSASASLPRKCASSTAKDALMLVAAMVAGAIMAVVTMRCGMMTTCTANAVVATLVVGICDNEGVVDEPTPL